MSRVSLEGSGPGRTMSAWDQGVNREQGDVEAEFLYVCF